MIEIYLKNNTNYENNGDITLQPISCVYSNSESMITLEHQIDDIGRWKYINIDNVLASDTTGKKVLYRIFNVVKTLDTIIAYARPIFYDLIDKVLLDVRPTNMTGEEALNYILKDTPFIGHSNISAINTSYYVRKNIVEAVAGDDENSFLNRWGGELYTENFDIFVNDKIGEDNGIRIELGYNLNAIEEDINLEDVTTRIIPVGYDGIMLEGTTPWVDSPLISNYSKIKEKVINFDDVRVKENEDEDGFSTIEEAREELRRQCKLLFEQGVDKPAINYKIDMINLADTTTYKDFKVLVDVKQGDTVTCYIKELDIDVKARVIDFERDELTGEYNSIELGNEISNFFNEQVDISNKVNNILNNNGSVKGKTIEGTINAVKTQFKALKDIAQQQDVRAIIFEDKIKDSPTFGCMCLGTMGFEIASSFKPGTTEWDFKTFGTGQGFFADYIVAGTLNANLIKAGIIKALNGKSWINLETGDAQITGTIKSQNGYQFVSIDSGGITFQDHHKLEQMLRMGTSHFNSNRDLNGVTFAMPQVADFLRFASIEKVDLTNGWSSEDAQTSFMEIWASDQKVGNSIRKKGATFFQPIYIKNKVSFDHKTGFYGDILSVTSSNDIDGVLGVFGDNGTEIGYKNGDSYMARIAVTEGEVNGHHINIWGNVNCNGWKYSNGIFVGLHVNSYSNSVTRTFTKTHCIEAEEAQVRVVFEDVQIRNGKAILNIPNKYVGVNDGYTIVSIVKKGKGDVWIFEEQESRFIIEADNEIKVNIEIIIKLNDSVKSVKEEITNDRS